MRLLIFIIFLNLTSCNVHKDYAEEKIKKNDYIYHSGMEKLVDKIIPNEKYKYWEYVWSMPHPQGKEDFDKIKLKKGKISSRKKYQIKNPTPYQGLFKQCMPGTCYYYIAYLENNKINYITTNEGLKTFIGKINNIEEALLVLALDDIHFNFDNSETLTYKMTPNGYELNMEKTIGKCPYDKTYKIEFLKIKIDFKANYTSKLLKTTYHVCDDIGHP